MTSELTRRVLADWASKISMTQLTAIKPSQCYERKSSKLVMSDLHMEAMGGIRLLRAIRADDELKKTPFILMTGSVGVPNVLAARYAGTDAYLLKPFTQEQLKAKLLEVLT